MELQNELLDETRRQLQAGEIKDADSREILRSLEAKLPKSIDSAAIEIT